ncbi:hypothetical protein [Micromonospora chersina]|uniref:hypothetical protein n=1 Tax=Micromonospora chersina TaxID=47854 RepID=UPI003710C97A
MVNPTWEDRDLPVLRAIVELYEESGGRQNRPHHIVERTGLDEQSVLRSLRALDGEYVEVTIVDDGTPVLFGRPNGEARRAVGLWPTPEVLADRLVQALALAAEQEPNEEKRGKLRSLGTWAGNAGRDLMVDVAAAALNRGMFGA